MPYGINETMGQYSELFMLLAAGTYTVAFIAFAWDLAKSSKALRAIDLKAAQAEDPARIPVGARAGDRRLLSSRQATEPGESSRPTPT
jgi:hypothetical protein